MLVMPMAFLRNKQLTVRPFIKASVLREGSLQSTQDCLAGQLK